MFAKIFCLFVVSTTLAALPLSFDAPEEDISEWNSYVEEHEKVYDSPEEESKRFGIFRENMKRFERLNEEHKGETTFGATVFSDLTSEEFMNLFSNEQRPEEAPGTPNCRLDRNRPLSTARDWRRHTTHIKNQGHCGSCYIFSVLGAIDAHLSIQNRTGAIDLSEQEVLDCGAANTCNSGYRMRVYEYAESVGVVKERDYERYTASKHQCHDPRHRLNRIKIKGHCVLPADETEIARAIDQLGPVAIGMNVNSQFSGYTGGIFRDYNCDRRTTNHAMLAVGYGEEANGQKFWLIKNSHGEKWGERGFLKIPRGENFCAIATYANYPVL